MIKLLQFSLGFKNKALLENIDSSFPDNTLTALIGRNGSGKSTLLKAICHLNNSYTGQILINDVNIEDLSPSELAKTVSYVNTQRPRISNMKSRDIVALGRTPYTGWSGRLNRKDREIVDDALAIVGMTSYADRTMESLSDGECQKIMIARAIAQDTNIMLLDEPTSFLDLPTRFELVGLLRSLAHENGKTILYSTHELDIALQKSDYIALIENPRLINMPTPEMKSSSFLSSLLP